MTRRLYIFASVLGAVASWAGLGYVIFERSPEHAAARCAFFLFFFAALATSMTLAAYFASFRLFSMKQHQGDLLRAGLRALPIALMLTLTALLQSLDLLSLGAILVFFAAAGMAELLLWPREARRRS